MFLRQFIPTNRNAEAAWSSLVDSESEDDRPPTYTSHVTAALTHTDGPGGRNGKTRTRNETMAPPDPSLTNTLRVAETSEVATPRYIYYRIYAEEYGAIPSRTSVAPGDPFLGRIKAISVAPPHTVNSVKLGIAKVEKIRVKDRKNTSLFLTPYSQSPMADAGKVTILSFTGLGSTPQEPLAFVAKMPRALVDFKRSEARLEPEGTSGRVSAVEALYGSLKPQRRDGRVGVAEALHGPLEPQERGGLARAAEGLYAPGPLEPRRRGGLTRAQTVEGLCASLEPERRSRHRGRLRAAEMLYEPWEPQGRGGLTRAQAAEELYAPLEPQGRGGLVRAATERLYVPLEPEGRGGLLRAAEASYAPWKPQGRGGLTRAQAAEELCAPLEPQRRGGLVRAATERLYVPLEPEGRGKLLRAAEASYAPWEPQGRGGLMSAADSEALYAHNAPEGRGGLASAAEPDIALPEIRYLYYLLYSDNFELSSKVAFDPEKPSLGRIRADSVAPPHSLSSIKRCISRVEGIPALAHADVFADISCDTPLEEDHISILRDVPGLSPNKPVAIVQMPGSKKDMRGRLSKFFG